MQVQIHPRSRYSAFPPNCSVLFFFTLFGLVLLHNHSREERMHRIHPFLHGPHSQEEKDQGEGAGLRVRGLKHKPPLSLLSGLSIGLTTQSTSPGHRRVQGGQNSFDPHLVPVTASLCLALSVLSF